MADRAAPAAAAGQGPAREEESPYSSIISIAKVRRLHCASAWWAKLYAGCSKCSWFGLLCKLVSG